jgi:hypothetical protein
MRHLFRLPNFVRSRPPAAANEVREGGGSAESTLLAVNHHPAGTSPGGGGTMPTSADLLKMSTCFGAARRVILDHLERRYDRRFNTVGAFVRFAKDEKLGLDFTTPPVRPDPAKMEFPEP